MSLQKITRNLIIATPALSSLIPADRWVPASALNEENAPARLFAVMRWGTTGIGVGPVRRHTLTIWVHDDGGSYEEVNSVLRALDARLTGVTHASDGEGSEIIQIDEPTFSGDLYDPGFRTITKNITFNIVGKGL